MLLFIKFKNGYYVLHGHQMENGKNIKFTNCYNILVCKYVRYFCMN